MPLIPRNLLAGLCWAALAITVWSGSLVLLRLAVTSSLNAYDVTALRFGVAAVVLAPVVVRRGLGTDRLRLAGPIGMVIAFGAPYVLLISLAMRTAPASAAGALNPGTMAVVFVLLSRVVFGDRIGVTRLAGLALTTAGIVLFTRTGGAVTTGHLLLFVSGTMWASYVMIVRLAAIPALNAAAIVAVGSAVVYWPVYMLVLPKRIAAAPVSDVLLQAGFQGVLVSVVAIYAFNRSAELLGAVAGATLPALIPVVTLGLGAVILGESAGPDEIASAALVTVGLALILVGVPATRWLLNRIPRRRRSPQA